MSLEMLLNRKNGSMTPLTAFAIWTKDINCVHVVWWATEIARTIWGKSSVMVAKHDRNVKQGFSLSSSLQQVKQKLTRVMIYKKIPHLETPKIHCFVLSSTFWELLSISEMNSKSNIRSIVSEKKHKKDNACFVFPWHHVSYVFSYSKF